MARDKVSICNAALDELPAENIQSIDDADSVGARACKRHFQNCISDLLSDWEYEAAIRRLPLAPTSNDRDYEWSHAYAEPSGAASLLRVLPYRAALDPTSVTLLPGQRLFPLDWGYFPENVGVRYVVANGKIYTHEPQAVVEFVTSEPDLGRMSSLFGRALELELAARICMPVIKSSSRQRELISMAEVARQRAVADDRNNSPDRYDTVASEEAMVRAGLPPAPRGWYSGGYS